MNTVLKAGIVLVPILALAAFVVPGWMGRSALAEQFEPELERFQAMRFKGEGKSGQLMWPKKVSEIDPDMLPAIAPGVFMMEPRKSVFIRTDKTEVRPAKIFEGFYDLDESLRAKTPADVRTLVFAQRQPRSVVYRPVKGVAMNQVLTQIVVIVKIFDVESKTNLGTWTLHGQDTPNSFRSDDTPTLGLPPTAAEFLEALPRR